MQLGFDHLVAACGGMKAAARTLRVSRATMYRWAADVPPWWAAALLWWYSSYGRAELELEAERRLQMVAWQLRQAEKKTRATEARVAELVQQLARVTAANDGTGATVSGG